jgi:1-acyl-sn-glycerol-3-phosphate acyltransferase
MRVKRAIRGCLSGFCFFIFGAGAVVIGVVILPVVFIFIRDSERGRFISIRIIQSSWRFFLLIMRAVGLIGITLSSNLETQLERIKGSVIVSNHPSLIDIIIISTLFPNPICIVKSKLKDNFFMKHIVRRIYITNDLAIDKMLGDCVKALKSGYNLIIFPEGTRSLPNIKPRYQRSPIHIAFAACSDIITVNISLTDNILGKHQRFYEVSDRRVLYTVTVKNQLQPSILQDEACPGSANVRKIMRLVKKDIE